MPPPPHKTQHEHSAGVSAADETSPLSIRRLVCCLTCRVPLLEVSCVCAVRQNLHHQQEELCKRRGSRGGWQERGVCNFWVGLLLDKRSTDISKRLFFFSAEREKEICFILSRALRKLEPRYFITLLYKCDRDCNRAWSVDVKTDNTCLLPHTIQEGSQNTMGYKCCHLAPRMSYTVADRGCGPCPEC